MEEFEEILTNCSVAFMVPCTMQISRATGSMYLVYEGL